MIGFPFPNFEKQTSIFLTLKVFTALHDYQVTLVIGYQVINIRQDVYF